MRRAVVALLLSSVLLPFTGCIFAVDVQGLPYHRQVVEVNGELYLVNLKTQHAQRMDVVWDVEEKTTTRTEETVIED